MRWLRSTSGSPTATSSTSSTPPAGLGAGADVVLDLTADGLAPGEGGHPPLGVWSLRFGRERRRLGAGAFEPEYLSGSGVGTCELVAELDTDDPAQQRPRAVPLGGRRGPVSRRPAPSTRRRGRRPSSRRGRWRPPAAAAAVADEPSAPVPATQAGGPSSSASVLRTMVQRGLREAAQQDRPTPELVRGGPDGERGRRPAGTVSTRPASGRWPPHPAGSTPTPSWSPDQMAAPTCSSRMVRSTAGPPGSRC